MNTTLSCFLQQFSFASVFLSTFMFNICMQVCASLELALRELLNKFLKDKSRLDRESIMSSLRYGFSTPYRLTIRNSTTLFNIVLFNMGDLHLVLPALNLSTLNAGILILMQQVRLMLGLKGLGLRVWG